MMRRLFATIIAFSLVTSMSFAHPGRTDSSGGHYVRTAGWGYPVGSYHYHNGGSSSSSGSSGGYVQSAESYYLFEYQYGQVTEFKGWLYQLGYYSGDMGDYGDIDKLVIAVKAFQRQHGLSATGKGDTNTRTHIYNEYLSSKNTARANIVGFNIYINGRLVNNANADYPFVTYKNMTYMPMTSDLIPAVGGYLIDNGGWLRIGTSQYYYNLNQLFLGSNNTLGQSIRLNIEIRPLYLGQNAYVDGATYPILNYKNVVYVPLSAYLINSAFPFAARWIDGDGLYLINN